MVFLFPTNRWPLNGGVIFGIKDFGAVVVKIYTKKQPELLGSDRI